MPILKIAFPEQYQHESGHTLSLDHNHIAIAFTRAREPDNNQMLELMLQLQSWDLEQEPQEGDVTLNHTERVFWLRSKKTLTTDAFVDIEGQLGDQVDWLAPVYSFPPQVSNNPICLLPDRLIVHPSNGSHELAIKIDQLLLKRFGLVNCPEITQYLGDYRLYLLPIQVRRSSDSRSLFDIRQLLLTNEFSSKGIAGALIDSMPMFRHHPPRPETAEHAEIHIRPPHWAGVLDKTIFGVWPKDGNGVTVAVIDADGFELNHPALQTAFVNGAQFYDDGTPTGGIYETSIAAQRNSGDHGTECAGVIGARPDPSKAADPNYMVGMAPGCSILPLYVKGYIKSLVASAIKYAAATRRADVISISDSEVGLDGNDPVGNALDSAFAIGTLICAATMNENKNEIHYPASRVSVMACGASNAVNDRCSVIDWGSGKGSNYGNNMSVAALGVSIKTTGSSGYRLFEGTSATTPQVAALAAILISTFPALKHRPQLTRDIIEQSAQKLGRTTVDASDLPVNPPGPALTYSTMKANGGWEREMGYGIIILSGAIQRAQQMLGAAANTQPPAIPSGVRIS